jgi:hypothetical protein
LQNLEVVADLVRADLFRQAGSALDCIRDAGEKPDCDNAAQDPIEVSEKETPFRYWHSPISCLG